MLIGEKITDQLFRNLDLCRWHRVLRHPVTLSHSFRGIGGVNKRIAG
jgi:hypothetical protein